MGKSYVNCVSMLHMKRFENSFAILLSILMVTLYIHGGTIFLILLMGYVLKCLLCPSFQYEWKNFLIYLNRYKFSIFLLFIIPFCSFIYYLQPLELQPSLSTLMQDCIFYYLLVGLIEEFICRALFLQAIYNFTESKKAAVVFSAVFYGICHIPSVWGQAFLGVSMRVLWSVGLGLYLGALYSKSKNYLFVSVIHMIADLSTIVFFFSNQTTYPAKCGAIVLILYILLGVYGLMQIEE